MYHGVSDGAPGVWTQVGTVAFEEQMAYLRARYSPADLESAVTRLYDRTLPAYAAAVTFDDGFHNNLSNALPVLKRHSVPATIYVTTSFIDGRNRSDGLIWTDYVYALLLATDRSTIDLTDYEVGSFVLTDRRSRLTAKEAICGALKRLPDAERQQALTALAHRCGNGVRPEDAAVFAPMSWDEVRQIAREPLIAIGAHTVEHPILTRLPRDRMIEEISTSQTVIQTETGCLPALFAYPNGTKDDFNDEIKEVVAERYSCAVSTVEGLNDAATDRYELRRIGIGADMPLWEFKLCLSGTYTLIARILGRR